jgi:serine/threonine-protein kinase
MDDSAEATDPQQAPPQASLFGTDADLSGLVLDDYKLLRRLGQGGMGQVYLAEQFSLKRQVALKIVRPEIADPATAATLLARFRAEAEAVARATHANIVQIYAIGRTGDLNYMSLEYVEGRNLREFVEKKKPISAAVGLKIMAQVAAALQRAGELNIIHRDIKPENILIARTGEVKVADFGLSRCFDRPQGLTKSGIVMGTPLYMSPEQVELQRPVDHRSDLYSFGATSYFMFAGQPPFKGETPIEVAYQHVHKQPVSLAYLRSDLPRDLCILVHKLMAKRPEARYQTAREVAREIERILQQLAVQAPSPLSTHELLASSSTSIQTTLPPPRLPSPALPWPRRPLVRYGLAGLGVLLALLIGLAIGAYRHRPAPISQPQPVPDDGASRALFTKDRERQLLSQVEEKYRPNGPLNADVLAGLSAAVDVGLLYLEERPPDNARVFFRKLCPHGEKGCHGRLLALLGEAMVLAFSDEAAKSNKQFVAITQELDQLNNAATKGTKGLATMDEVEVYKLLWKTAPTAAALREMVARAVNHNYHNDPKSFPPSLEPLRSPPRPVIKGAPPGP